MGVHRLVAGGTEADPVVQDGHDVAIRMDEGQHSALVDAGYLFSQVGQDELAEMGGRDEGAAIARDVVDQHDEIGPGIC